ncbi:MAG: hypothetical protein DRN95_03660 [Candidatus Hydrothermarchaeota archaeon]|nr:MAG: hypothetical protein DRN95_03660 [Candidatus Hydrothermarchaeota archaeon]
MSDDKRIVSVEVVEVGEIDPVICEEKMKGKIKDGKCHVALVEYEDGSKEFREYDLIEKKGGKND